MEYRTDTSDDEKSPCEYREDLFNALCGDAKPLIATAAVLPPKAQCPVCNKWFRDKTRVHEHLNVHYGARPLICNVCGTNFAARSNLIKHSQQHHAPFSCHICGCGCGPFCDLRALNEHTRNKHPELHRFACHLCNSVFLRQADLSEHLISHPPALLEVRRRKRATAAAESPTEALSDGDELPAKRIRAAPQSTFRVDASDTPPFEIFQASKDPESETFPTAAFFGLDAASLKHATVEELASHITKLSNLAASLHQNGAFSFSQLGFSDNTSRLLSESLSNVRSAATDPQSQSKIQVPSDSDAPVNPKLPAILLRKQSAGGLTISAPVIDKDKKPKENKSETPAKTVGGGSSEIGVQCCLLEEQATTPSSAETGSASVPPCQRDMLVFQQLLAKLVSRGDVFRCQYCEMVFFERGIYCLHRSLHDEQDPFQCAICGKRCADKDNFTLHFVNQKHQTGGCCGTCAPLSPEVSQPPCSIGH